MSQNKASLKSPHKEALGTGVGMRTRNSSHH